VPGATDVKLVGPTAVAVQPCGSCSPSWTSGNVSSPLAVIWTCTVDAWPSVTVEGAVIAT
jgi:hypothetical protein